MYHVAHSASIILFTEAPSSVRKLAGLLSVEFSEVEGQATQSDLDHELRKDLELMPRPSTRSLSLINELPFGAEEAAARLLELEQMRRQPPKALHMGMPGYITYQLDMDVEFNSLKYVWNFLKEEFPGALSEEIRGMHKYETERGVVFNVPE